MVALVRYCSQLGLHAFEVVFYRNFVALILLMPWLMRSGGIKTLHTTRIKMYTLRALIGLVAMYFWFYSLITIPLADATALSFTAPLFTAILAMIILKEKIGIHRISALAIGFLGVLVVLRPGTDVFELKAVSAVAAAMLWAFSGIIIKALTSTDEPRKVVFYMVLMMTPLSLPLALPHLNMPDWHTVFWLVALGFTSNLFQIALSNAFAATDISVILPFDFTRLIFVSVIAYLVFGETLDMWTLLGAIIILAGAAYTSYREALHVRQHSKTPEEII